MSNQDTWTDDKWAKIKAIINDPAYDYQPGFERWLKKNFPVWRAFVLKTKEAHKLQHRHRFSAYTIIQLIRWDTAVRENSTMFKISNNFTPDLSRLVMELHEPLRGFFRTSGSAYRNDSPK